MERSGFIHCVAVQRISMDQYDAVAFGCPSMGAEKKEQEFV